MPLTPEERERQLERQYRQESIYVEPPEPVPTPPPPTQPWTIVEQSPCGGAQTFANAVRKLGYDVTIAHAVGPWLHADGRWDDEREAVRVTIAREGVHVGACWWTRVAGKEAWAVHRGMAAGLIGPLSATQLKKRLTNPEEDPRV